MNESKITALLQELESNLENLDLINEKVSKASVGWHISHSIQIFSAICKNVIESDPKEYSPSFNKNRFKIRTIGYIPRGLGRSPKAFLNQDNVESEQLKAYLKIAHEQLASLGKVSQNHFFIHPIFGQLNKKRTYWFLHLHTKHHLKIIRDIVSSQPNK